ncbi:MAG: protein jag [Actinobacteria bacterium]|nr:protein jag [Actinomycetota bacterium]
MAEEVERSAASVEEAVEAALEQLGLTEQQAIVEIVQEPRGGFLGLKSQEAIVRVRAKRPPDAELSADELEEQAEVAADFLEGLFQRMGLEVDVEPAFVDGIMYIDVWGAESDEGMGLLIGKHGQTIDSLQEILRSAVQRRTGERCRVLIDVEDYRKRRRSQVASRARQAAGRVRKSGREEMLEPMSAFERKVVHDAVAGMGTDLETASEGDEPNRRVVIRPVA